MWILILNQFKMIFISIKALTYIFKINFLVLISVYIELHVSFDPREQILLFEMNNLILFSEIYKQVTRKSFENSFDLRIIFK